jgi:hypothetical protein
MLGPHERRGDMAFIIGFITGGIVGVLAMACLFAASDADDAAERWQNEYEGLFLDMEG